MKNKLYVIGILTLIFCVNAFGQLSLPRESNFSSVSQTVGDTKIVITYHRPNIKGRKVWGEAPPAAANGTATLDGTKDAPLVVYGHVWRTGANENTTFEVSNDVQINGQPLPAGKYGLHTIPNQNEWIIIFNKVNNEWGSFRYDAKQDQLRVTAKPQTSAEFQETMSLNFANVKGNTADIVIAWEKLRVPFTVNVGDIKTRVLADVRKQIAGAKADDFRTPIQGANWVFGEKLTANYAEALGWVDKALAVRETFSGLSLKAQLLAATGKKAEAITTAEKAITVGKAASPAANTANLEKILADWKAGK
jgi:hypothetical protein